MRNINGFYFSSCGQLGWLYSEPFYKLTSFFDIEYCPVWRVLAMLPLLISWQDNFSIWFIYFSCLLLLNRNLIWWKGRYILSRDLCHWILVLISFTYKVEDLLQCGNPCYRHLRNLSKDLYCYSWSIKKQKSTHPFFLSRPFFTPRRPVLVSSLGEVPLARWLLSLCHFPFILF